MVFETFFQSLTLLYNNYPIAFINVIAFASCILYYLAYYRPCTDFMLGFGHDLEGNRHVHTILWLASAGSLVLVLHTDYNRFIHNGVIEAILLGLLLIHREFSFNSEGRVSYYIHEIWYYIIRIFGYGEITDKQYSELTDEEVGILKAHKDYQNSYDRGYEEGFGGGAELDAMYSRIRFTSTIDIYASSYGFYCGFIDARKGIKKERS
jgi:hypothetical protein